MIAVLAIASLLSAALLFAVQPMAAKMALALLGGSAGTTAATKAFQKASGLEQTGQVDAKTWAKLKGKLFAAKTGTSPAQRLGERDGSVKKTEKKLKKCVRVLKSNLKGLGLCCLRELMA